MVWWVVSNVLLKMWGNHNQEEGDNSAVGYYLFFYGMLALGSALLAFAASVLLWVFCAIKSARSLHDAVSPRPLAYLLLQEETDVGLDAV